jgi:DNA replication protein DnaC
MKERAIASQLPKRYRQARLVDFKAETCDAVVTWLADPTDGLFIGGPAGSGKTHLCAGIVRAKIETGDRALFRRAADLYLQVRESYGAHETTEAFILEQYCRPQVLIIDDIGAGSLSDYERRILLEIIDRRLNELYPTVVTSNWTIGEIGAKIDERLASRLKNFRVIGFTGKDRRHAA